MAAESTTFTLRGKRVEVREGDLLLSRWGGTVSLGIAVFDNGASHVSTVLNVGGRLMIVDSCGHAWKDGAGKQQKAGVAARDIEDMLDDPKVHHVWHVKERRELSTAQLVAMRLVATDAIKANERYGSLYEKSLGEFVHTLLGWKPATLDRFHCAEFAARLRRAAGLWSKDETTSVSIPQMARHVGDEWQPVF
tara:strand:+ start:2201 stop:2779 length:579 start_codon:yes stop_codon:yes gene_type:complete